jgi:c-di-GMP-binding flagellar brake protein YcgR
MASDEQDDRRRHQRVSTRAAVRIAAGDHTHEGETRDVSEGGMGLVSSERLERGAKVSVEVLVDGPKAGDPKTIKTMATVMWSAETDTGAYTAGLKFDGPSPEALVRLQRFLAANAPKKDG